MTKVTIIKPDQQKKMIPLREGEYGKWYMIAKYDPNPVHIGKIGILFQKIILDLSTIYSSHLLDLTSVTKTSSLKNFRKLLFR